MASLRRNIDFLTPQQAGAIRPYRLRIVTVKEGESGFIGAQNALSDRRQRNQ